MSIYCIFPNYIIKIIINLIILITYIKYISYVFMNILKSTTYSGGLFNKNCAKPYLLKS